MGLASSVGHVTIKLSLDLNPGRRTPWQAATRGVKCTCQGDLHALEGQGFKLGIRGSCHSTLRGRKEQLEGWRIIRDIFYSLFLEQRLSTCGLRPLWGLYIRYPAYQIFI